MTSYQRDTTDKPLHDPRTAQSTDDPAVPDQLDSAGFQQRWRDVQAGFVDDPRDAVEQADRLLDAAVSALTSRRQGLVDRWKSSDRDDTEQLRLALRDYRSMLDDLVGLHSATAGQDGLPARRGAR